MFERVEAIQATPTRHIAAAFAVTVLLGACQGPPPTVPSIDASDSPAAEPFAIPTAIPLATFVVDSPTLQPQRPAQAPLPTVEQLTVGAPGSLLDLKPGDRLKLIADIAIPRTDFGVRLAFSPIGHMLLHSGNGMIIQRYDLLLSQPAPDLTGFELMSPLTISISPDGSAVAADDGPQILVWDSQTGQQLSALQLPPISALASAGFYRDQLYFTVDFDGNVLIWDPQSWGEITRFTYPGRIDSAVLYPDGGAIALQDRDRNQISVFDVDGHPLGTVSFEGQNARLLSVSPSGDRFLLHVDYGSPAEGVAVISAETGSTELKLDLLNFRKFAVSSDWKLLAAVGVYNELRLYALPEGELLVSQSLGVSRTLSLLMSPAAEYLALYAIKQPGQGGVIQVWAADLGG